MKRNRISELKDKYYDNSKMTMNSAILDFISMRQLGVKRPSDGLADRVFTTMYSNMESKKETFQMTAALAVNNMDFSPDGRLLVAVTADRCLKMLDPISRKLSNCIYLAHESSINAIRFLNDYTFATCGDDSAVRVWDARNPRQHILSLIGHGSWVKSVEHMPSHDSLISCSLDGTIVLWDLDGCCTPQGAFNRRIALMPGVVRVALSPNGRILALTTTAGFILLVHDLNIATLPRLLDGFFPVLYRCMYRTKTPMPAMMKFNYLFAKDRKENRLEFIDDWVPENYADIITSAQFHPHGHYLMSRNWNRTTSVEYTCVHDVAGNGYWYPKKASRLSQIKRSRNEAASQRLNSTPNDDEPMVLMDILQSLTRIEEVRLNSAYHRRYTVHSSGIAPPEILLNPPLDNRGLSNLLEQPDDKLDEFRPCGPIPPEYYHHKRLICYRKERRISTSYHTIRENAWSHDGRVVAAPSGNEVRLYRFDRDRIDLPLTEDDVPVSADQRIVKELPLVKSLLNSHGAFVVCTRFRPHHLQLVSGCQQGKIVWHEPTF